MSEGRPTQQAHSPRAFTRRILRWALQTLALTLMQALCLFLASGQLNWAWGWAYLGLVAGNQVSNLPGMW